MERVEAEVMDKLLRKCGQATEQDLQKILKKARKQQEELIRQRDIDRIKQNEKVRQRLLEKRTAKVRRCHIWYYC